MLSEAEEVDEGSKIYIYGANEVANSISGNSASEIRDMLEAKGYKRLEDAKKLGDKNSVGQELAGIKAKAIADGTIMKAPNGKPTNLNERQWLHARTKAFKEWFGDRQKLSEQDVIKALNLQTLNNLYNEYQKDA
ncbi:MAG: hypothetical protein KIT66_08350 [Chitinophagaceae bacterium]|nr:hypothetical protein [Chitinophagaceae bacterium]MCZ2395289.1 hypothetical protein [Chitinophagales bacterium]